MSKISCVYLISFPDGMVYVGSTVDFKNRIGVHKYSIKNPRGLKSRKTHLHAKMEKFGFDRCKFSILEECKKEVLLEREQQWLDHYRKCAINKSGPVNKPCLGLNRDRSVVDNILKTRSKNMPYFMIATKCGRPILITNNYKIAGKITRQSPDSVRKKLRNGRPCRKYSYNYCQGVTYLNI